MKKLLKQIDEQNKQWEMNEVKAIEAEISDPKTTNSRREFLKKAAIGGIALGGATNLSSIEETIEQTTSKVQRSSAPSELKITDLRLIAVDNCGIIRLIQIRAFMD